VKWWDEQMKATITVRKASLDDVEKLHHIIQGYAQDSIMLPRSLETLRDQIATFVIAEQDDQLIGCGSLTQLGLDLVEIRSLGITDGYKGQGIGGKLVDFLVEEARHLKMKKVMALTYEVAFFLKNGFTLVPKEVFPEKVWRDCIHCKKQFCCDEIAVLKRLD
jgi:amino-acid N-acetyltransferase